MSFTNNMKSEIATEKYILAISSNSTYNLVILACFAYLVLRLLYLAFMVPFGAPPDELVHFEICKLFSQAFFLPNENHHNGQAGNIVDIPWLYYFVMGKILFMSLNDEIITLRVVNCFFTFLFVLYSFRWISLLTDKRLAHILFLVLLTNTTMLTYLGSSVSYDNLCNLFAISTLYYLHKYIVEKNFQSILFFSISLLAGALTKVTFLPLAIIYIFILLFHIRKNLKKLFLIKDCDHNFKLYISLTLIVFLLICNLQLYAGNIVRYGSVVPSPVENLSDIQLMNNTVSARDRIFENYRSGLWSKDKIITMAVESDNYEAFLSALKFINNYEKNSKEDKLSLPEYALFWLNLMVERTFNIFSHTSYQKPTYILVFYKFILSISLIIIVYFLYRNDSGVLLNQSLIVVLFYSLFLMVYVNYYGFYFKTLIPSWSIQGRYIFPVIVPIYGLVSYFMTKSLHGIKLNIVVTLISVAFILFDFPKVFLNISFSESYASTSQSSRNIDEVHSRLAETIGDYYLHERGNNKMALTYYQQSVALSPDDATSHYKLGNFYEKLAYSASSFDVEDASTTEPRIYDIKQQKTKRDQLSLNHFEEAITEYKTAIQLDRSNSFYYYSLGQLYSNKGYNKEASIYLGMATQLEPDNPSYCCLLGQSYIKENEHDKALILFKEAIQNDNNNICYYRYLGELSEGNGSLHEAIKYYKHAVEISPEGSIYYFFLGRAYKQVGLIKESEKMLMSAIDLDSKKSIYYRLLADLYMENNQLGKAIKIYKQAIMLEPNNASYHYLLGSAYREKGLLDKARKNFTEAVRLDPNNPWYHRFLGQIYELSDEPKHALHEYKQAVKLGKDIPAFHYYLGEFYEKIGLRQKALDQYEIMVKLEPENRQYVKVYRTLNARISSIE